MRRGETATLSSLKWEPSTLALGPELTEAIEQRPNPPCLLYSGLELRQGGMARSEAAQSLRGTRNLYRLGADAGLFHDFENRAPASGSPWHSHQVASSRVPDGPASGDAGPLHRRRPCLPWCGSRIAIFAFRRRATEELKSSMPGAQWSARGRSIKLPSRAPARLASVCQSFVKVSHRP